MRRRPHASSVRGTAIILQSSELSLVAAVTSEMFTRHTRPALKVFLAFTQVLRTVQAGTGSFGPLAG